MIVVLKHIAIEGPGTLGEFLSRQHRDVRAIELQDGGRLPRSLEGIEAVICLGGPMNVYEEDKYPFLKEEDVFIKKTVAADIPFLGICLGSQLLSKACGGIVEKATVRQIGWSKVELTEQGALDPLFAGTPGKLAVFQWHEDTFSVPAGGVLLATAEDCRNQAFRMGRRAYGFQFHIEVTPEMVKNWISAYVPEQDKEINGGRILDETCRREAEYRKQALGIYGNLEKI